VKLSDGTRVVLAPASRLLVPDDYDRGRRDLHLNGAAFFDVKDDSLQRFIVHTERGIVEDLGTAFTVRSYEGDPELEVGVVSGSVALTPSDSLETDPTRPRSTLAPTVLIAGQMAWLARDGVVRVHSDTAVRGDTSWIRGVLRFDRVPLSELLVELQRWYGLDITLSDSSLSVVPVTAEFKDGSAGDALRALALLLDIRYERTGQSVRLYRIDRP
jgi:transmembrane sensor